MLKDSNQNKKNLTELSKRIRQARIEAHLSQEELAAAIGVSDKSISAYELDRATPSLTKLQSIAASTKHSLTYFTEEKMDQTALKNKITNIEKELSQIKKMLKNQNN